MLNVVLSCRHSLSRVYILAKAQVGVVVGKGKGKGKVMILIIICGAFWRIHVAKSCGESTLWVGILCSAAGYILP